MTALAVHSGHLTMRSVRALVRNPAYLLITLVLIQFICPLLFKNDSTQWWVSAGVVVGYGAMLFIQLRQRLTTK